MIKKSAMEDARFAAMMQGVNFYVTRKGNRYLWVRVDHYNEGEHGKVAKIISLTDAQRIEGQMQQVPAEFGLRAFPGDVFRISRSSSYVNDSKEVMLYTEIRKGDEWLSFAKGTLGELRNEITRL